MIKSKTLTLDYSVSGEEEDIIIANLERAMYLIVESWEGTQPTSDDFTKQFYILLKLIAGEIEFQEFLKLSNITEHLN